MLASYERARDSAVLSPACGERGEEFYWVLAAVSSKNETTASSENRSQRGGGGSLAGVETLNRIIRLESTSIAALNPDDMAETESSSHGTVSN